MSAESVAESIPTGYKQTEVGVIPEDWKLVTIGDFAIKVGSGITPRGGNSNYKEYGRPFVRSQNVGWGTLLLNDLVYIDDDTHKSFSSTELQQGDVLLNITGASIGRSAIAEAHLAGGNVNQHVCIIRTNTSKVVSRFLNYIILSSQGQRQIDSFQAGGNREGLNFGQVRSIRFPLPPTLAEQEAIVTALSDTDSLIESLEQLIAKKRQIKQGAMQELLTGKRRLPGFSGEWEVKCVGNVLKIAHGRSQHAVENQNGIYPILATGGQIGTANQFLYDKPSVLIGRKGTIDKPRFMDKPFWTVDTLFYSIILEPNNAKFLYYNFCLIDWKQYNEASGVPSLNAHTIEQIVLIVPSPEEQTAIATILSDMDSEITVLEEKLAKTRQIKQGMMQELLTGRIRLV